MSISALDVNGCLSWLEKQLTGLTDTEFLLTLHLSGISLWYVWTCTKSHFDKCGGSHNSELVMTSHLS